MRNIFRSAIQITSIFLLVAPCLCNTGFAASQPIENEKPSLDLAQRLSDQMEAFYDNRDFESAIPLAERVLAIRMELQGTDHPETARSTDALGRVYAAAGSANLAVEYFTRSLSMRERILGPEHRDTAKSINNLALSYQMLGDFAAAEPLYQRALAAKEGDLGPNDPSTALTLHNFGNMYRESGAYAQAEMFLRRAVETRERILGAEHLNTANTQQILSMLYQSMDRMPEAEALATKACAVHERLAGVKARPTVECLNNIAELYASTGKFAESKEVLLRVLAIEDQLHRSDQKLRAHTLSVLAALYTQMGEYEKADPLYEETIAIRKKLYPRNHFGTAASLAASAVSKWNQGKSREALTLFKEARDRKVKNSVDLFRYGSEFHQQSFLQTMKRATDLYISFSLSTSDLEATTFGYDSVLQYKGRVMDSLSKNMSFVRQSTKAEDQLLLSKLADVANQLSTLTFQPQSKETDKQYLQRKQELTAFQQTLERDLAKRNVDLPKEIEPIDFARISRSIPEKAALLEFFRYHEFDPKALFGALTIAKPHYIAYVLKRNAHPVVIDFGRAESIEKLIGLFQKSIGDPTNGASQIAIADLSKTLLGPLQPHIHNVNHLIISPDGLLSLVPFSAMRNDRGEYLATDHEISYLTNARDLLDANTPSLARNPPIIVANPDFGSGIPRAQKPSSKIVRSPEIDRSGLFFKSLNATAAEASALQKTLKASDKSLLLGPNATEERIKAIHRPLLLHIASHGFFLGDQGLDINAKQTSLGNEVFRKIENPLLRSGIALSGANLRSSGSSDDGILTAMEVAHLDLQGTELVVLSACDTGIGEIKNSEGVYGLRRALVLAGARAQATSLWKVPDEATRILMDNYYRRLLKGEGRSAALRHAQADVRKNSAYSHPYYWASFILIGDWNPFAIAKPANSSRH